MIMAGYTDKVRMTAGEGSAWLSQGNRGTNDEVDKTLS